MEKSIYFRENSSKNIPCCILWKYAFCCKNRIVFIDLCKTKKLVLEVRRLRLVEDYDLIFKYHIKMSMVFCS